jgi:hypothetical protein
MIPKNTSLEEPRACLDVYGVMSCKYSNSDLSILRSIPRGHSSVENSTRIYEAELVSCRYSPATFYSASQPRSVQFLRVGVFGQS